MSSPTPTHLRRARSWRPLKRWRYVGVFNEELLACAAIVHVGPATQTFWAVLWRADSRLRERTHLLPRRGAVRLDPGRLRISDGGVRLDLTFAEETGWEATCPHGAAQVWTRKQAGISAHGTIGFDGREPREIEALAVIDDTAGYHARVTEWWWAAGVGLDPEGRALAFNLVEGVNDPASGSERAVWIDGEPHEAAPVSFARDLSCITATDGSRLSFSREAERQRHENLLIVSSDYRAPFGTFSGTLPGGIELTHGLGVVEHHRARW
jgi:Protein of unknown function (DUF2804)